MKLFISSLVKPLLADRALLGFLLAFLLIIIGLLIDIALNIDVSDLQVATRYTAYGERHFYRNQWYYLLTLAGLGLVMLIGHTALVLRLNRLGMVTFARAFAGFSVLMAIVVWIVAHSILRIAFLG